MENLIKKYDLSEEIYQKLEAYVRLLLVWQEKFNLVSKSSLNEVWTRHIEDSAQLFKFMNNGVHSVYDMGSGAGFPAMVLAIIAQEKRPDISFTLIESIRKKTLYLNAVKEELRLENVQILNGRVENLDLRPADMITARAMTSLEKLIYYATKIGDQKTICVFPKGRNYSEELEEAKKLWNFDLEISQSEVEQDSAVLILKNIVKKKSSFKKDVLKRKQNKNRMRQLQI